MVHPFVDITGESIRSLISPSFASSVWLHSGWQVHFINLEGSGGDSQYYLPSNNILSNRHRFPPSPQKRPVIPKRSEGSYTLITNQLKRVIQHSMNI